MYGNRLSMFINTLLSNLNPENGDPLLQATFELLRYKAKNYDPRFYTVTPDSQTSNACLEAIEELDILLCKNGFAVLGQTEMCHVTAWHIDQ